MPKPPTFTAPQTPFGAYMPRSRRHRHLMQRELADLMGISSSYLCAMETGRREPPSGEALNHIAAVMDLDSEQRDSMALAAEQSRRKLLLPLRTTFGEYVLFHALLHRVGRLRPEAISAIKAILERSELQ